MTRRTKGLNEINENPNQWMCSGEANDDETFTFSSDQFHTDMDEKCPYGKPGDVLWVRETFCPMVISDFDGDGNDKHTYLFKTEPNCMDILNQMEDATWKPSIHMPKSVARIWLEIVSIKPQRLQDISREDCRLEGIKQIGATYRNYMKSNVSTYNERVSFQTLWISINGYESWAANPWVWAIEFKVLSTTGKEAILS